MRQHNRVVSWWDLIKDVEGHALVRSLSMLNTRLGALRAQVDVGQNMHLPIDPAARSDMIVCVSELQRAAASAGATVTHTAASRFLASLKANEPMLFAWFQSALTSMNAVAVHEFESVHLFVIPSQDYEHFAPTEPLFGPEVDEAFPSSRHDIAEAGKCRALGRHTAAVMHLMRALEPALNTLAAHFQVVPEQNWNAACRDIEAALRSIQKSKDGAEAEQWASEATAHFRAIKNAWRNYAAHGRDRYDEDEAVSIYHNARSLMRTLSKQLTETN